MPGRRVALAASARVFLDKGIDMGLQVAAISAEQIEAERDGIWRLVPCTIDNDLEAVEFRVRLWDSSGAQEEFMKLLQRNQALASGKSNDAQTYKTICQKKALVFKCLAGWRTVALERTDDESEPYRRVAVVKKDEIEFEAGNWISFSKGSSERLLERKFREIYESLQQAAHDDDAYREYLEDAAKNAPVSSDGNSSI